MNMPGEKISMYRPGKGAVVPEVTVQKEANQLDCGSETVVHRAEITYSGLDRIAGGLVVKRLRHPYKNRAELEPYLEDILSQWEYIRSAMVRRKKEGKDTFHLPTTIRGYKSKTEVGVIMNDLTEGGKNRMFDLKQLMQSSQLVPYGEWTRIKEQILRDLRIASEEGIILAKEDYLPLDAWIVVYKDEQPNAYVVDIGEHTAFEGSPKLRQDEWRRKTDREILTEGERAVKASLRKIEELYK